ncbi:ribonuclease I [Rhizobium sp. PP-F2F-G38]|nr:ribonuclease I [Rhizobium sp. PP-WC-1G-195]PYF00880.1 ribonuclease I [Rhizobium sp. PP-F2F-G38]
MTSTYMEMMVIALKRGLRTFRPVLVSCAIITASCAAYDVHAAELAAPQAAIGRNTPHLADSASPIGVSGILPSATPALPVAAETSPPTSVRIQPDPSVTQKGETRQSAPGKTGFVLGLSWLPAFCETRAKRPECVGQSTERADATQLTLAGLWPVRNSFCKVSEALQAEDRKRDWLALPAVPLSADVATKLAASMPGTALGFDRHTWLRSGTCQVLDPDAYFSLQIRLLEAVNTSAVGALFRSRIGNDITEAEVKAAFDQSFAAGAGDRIRLQCRQVGDRMLVTGLTIGLSATMEETSDLGALIHAAAPTRSRCSGGVVDAAGRVRPERQAVAGQIAPGASGAAKLVDVR